MLMRHHLLALLTSHPLLNINNATENNDRRPSLSSLDHQISPKNLIFWPITRKEIWPHDVLHINRKPPIGSLGAPTILTPGAPDPQKLGVKNEKKNRGVRNHAKNPFQTISHLFTYLPQWCSYQCGIELWWFQFHPIQNGRHCVKILINCLRTWKLLHLANLS